jgi:hypothetical protein
MAIIPDGYGLATAEFQLTGLRKKPAITMGFYSAATVTAAFCNTVWRESLCQVGGPSPFEPSNMDLDWSLVATKVILNMDGEITSDQNLTVVEGTAEDLHPPSPNVSIIVAKNTALAGRQYRGRLFAPPCNIDEGDIDKNGTIVSTARTAQQTWWNHVRSNMISNSLFLYLLHEPPKTGPTPVPTSIASLGITQLVGTNRRRIR